MPVRELETHGFVEAVRSLRLNVDLVRADAHSAYYIDHTVVERLRTDVIAPAQAKGYTSIWLAGISLGGLGAVLYADAHPADVAGLFLISPYFGNAGAAEAIARGGGLKRWRAPSEPPFGMALETQAWRSLGDLSRRGRAQFPIYVGYGLQDWNAPVVQVLAEALPASDVFTLTGRHDWKPWLELWKRMLAASSLQRC
ncbi:alpha/beta hydrolase [Variovorax sp. J22P271]|uniref:alpha/beta fold hydrolase n=1 Tax=Variovorax davisae TaxID=3053515 RepID=UPI0025755B5B|nr:alpha/beta hydrolase [Variovorax sp. J22P271]MDM0032225.1 alpha/beta hydrolase [Variovorax sp. J22P271]